MTYVLSLHPTTLLFPGSLKCLLLLQLIDQQLHPLSMCKSREGSEMSHSLILIWTTCPIRQVSYQIDSEVLNTRWSRQHEDQMRWAEGESLKSKKSEENKRRFTVVRSWYLQVLYRCQLDLFQFVKEAPHLIQEASSVLTNWRTLNSVWECPYRVWECPVWDGWILLLLFETVCLLWTWGVWTWGVWTWGVWTWRVGPPVLCLLRAPPLWIF